MQRLRFGGQLRQPGNGVPGVPAMPLDGGSGGRAEEIRDGYSSGRVFSRSHALISRGSCGESVRQTRSL